MDLGLVAHLASLRSSVPFVHFFDGTSLGKPSRRMQQKSPFGEGRCFCWGGLVEVGHKGRDVCFGGSWWSWQRQFWGETLRKTLKSTCSLSGLDVFFLNVPTQYICFLHGEGFAYRREIRAWLLKPHTLFHFFFGTSFVYIVEFWCRHIPYVSIHKTYSAYPFHACRFKK